MSQQDTMDILNQMINRARSKAKEAQMTADEAMGSAGMPPGGDPAAAGMDPMAGGMPMGPPPSIEDMAQMGDPIANFLIELRQEFQLLSKKQDMMIEAIGQLMDSQGMQVPASQALGAEINAAALQEVQKQAEVPTVIDDTEIDESDSDKNILTFGSNKQSEFTLGRPANPGDNGAIVINTGIISQDVNPKRAAVAKHWARKRM